MKEKEEKPLRIFCAVELPLDARREVAQYIETLRTKFAEPRASWERKEKLHLTLKFFGDVERERIEGLKRAADRAASGIEAFGISIEGTGAFPPKGEPRVLWLGVRDETGRLSLLQRRIEEECSREGFEKERRKYSPHLTIARLRSRKQASELAEFHCRSEFKAVSFKISALTLMRSELLPGGSLHTPLSEHPLN